MSATGADTEWGTGIGLMFMALMIGPADRGLADLLRSKLVIVVARDAGQ
ncbi:MAG: hypothetical protein ABIV51_11840 [Saprospiraceae bacterium]